MSLQPSYEELQERIRELEKRLGSHSSHPDNLDVAPDPSRRTIHHNRTLFEDVPVPLWEEDFTEVYDFFEQLKQQGIEDFRAYFKDNDEAVISCARRVRVLNVNKAAVKMYQAGDKNHLLGSLNTVFTDNSLKGFREELIALAQGETEFEIEGEVRTVTGESRHILLKLVAQKKSSGKMLILLATIDITKRKQTEKLLETKEENYRLLVENQSDMVVKVDPEGRFLYVSPSYCKTFGKSEEELLGSTFLPLVHPEDRAATEQAMQQLFSPPHNVSIQQRAMTVDGWRWIAWSDTAVVDDQGEVIEIIGVGRDIHHQKLTETSLIQSERRFREIIEDVSAISIQGYNEDRHVLFWNRASEKLYGYSRTEAVGRKLEDLIIPEHMREEVKHGIQNWLDKGIKVPDGPLVLQNKAGEDVPVYSSHVLLDSSQGKELFCIDIDLEPVQKAERELKASERLLSRINRCFLNFTPNPLENINRLVRLAGEQFASTSALYNRLSDGVLKTIGHWNTPPNYHFEDTAEGHICHDTIRNGSEEPVVVTDLQNSCYASTDPNVSTYGLQTYVGKSVCFAGKYRGSLCVIFDRPFLPSNRQKKMLGILAAAIGIEEERLIDQQQAAQAQYHAAEREKQALVGKIAGKMAHDFNNILGAVMGNAELALLDCNDEEIRETLELILDQTLKGRNLTRNLVAFAKDQEPKQEYFSINDKIDLVLNLLKKDMQNIEIVREWGPGLPEILADPGMIEHCLVNLLQNSIHAMSLSTAPKMRLRTYRRDRQICIQIIDNGCGIPAQYKERIFEPAFTLKGGRDINGSYAPDIKGTGYGMANVKKYIEQHHGSIDIESQEEIGTMVTICFPEIHKKLSQKEVQEITSRGLVSGKRILLVEDEPAISEVQYRVLTDPPCNHGVDLATNGQMAIDLIDRNDYDLVSLDFVLPGPLSGIDVYIHLRKKQSAVPVLFISGNLAFLESIKTLKHEDANIDHVPKPCQNKEYINRITELLEKRQ